jgi:LTXXQ motif family protein
MHGAHDQETDTPERPDNVIRPPAGWWRQRRRLRGAARGPEGPEDLARLTSRVADDLDLTPPQRAAWHGVTGLLTANAGAFERLRDQREALLMPDPAPVRLGRIEALLVTGLDVVHQVRPAFEAFYATLDEGRKRRLDALIERRRRRRRP